MPSDQVRRVRNPVRSSPTAPAKESSARIVTVLRRRKRHTKALRRALESGARLTGSVGGSVGGAGVGLVLGGPPGALVGGAAGQWAGEEFVSAGIEIIDRVLSPRAEARVGLVFRLADDEVSARLMTGDLPRDDLRVQVMPGRTQAEELIEAAFIAAAETYEERKLPYIAHLLSALVFEPDLTHSHANQLVATARDVTYRQLLVLAVLAAREQGDGLKFLGPGHEQEDPSEAEQTSIRIDMLDLFRRGLLRVYRHRYSSSPELSLGGDRDRQPWPVIPREMSPRDTRASTSGERLVRMMRLDLTPAQDQETLVVRHIGR